MSAMAGDPATLTWVLQVIDHEARSYQVRRAPKWLGRHKRKRWKRRHRPRNLAAVSALQHLAAVLVELHRGARICPEHGPMESTVSGDFCRTCDDNIRKVGSILLKEEQ